ncbi:MAG: immunoglobulin domain-containing protein, partial [Opitutaceae bacterium]|nr:immunoglobulin domain-containing protein [Opitutaceae bacterium]
MDVPVKPKVTKKPASKTETGIGQTVTLAVSATGTPPPTFQWLLDGKPVPGATGATLVIVSVAESDLGKYSVIVTSGPNKIMTTVTTLGAILPPVIETPAVSETDYTNALAAKGAKLSIKLAKNKAKPTYQWLLDGEEIPGATKATYTAKKDGAYSIRVTNGAGTVEKRIGNIKLVTPPKFDATAGLLAETPAGDITAKPEVVANVGQSVVFTAKLATGTGPFTWTWLRNGKQIVRTHVGSSLTDTFIAENITTADKYSVQVESVADAKGKPLAKAKSKTVAIKIVVPPTVAITTPSDKLTAVPGKPVSIAAKATGTAKLNYEWRGPDGTVIAGVNKATLTLKPASRTDTVVAGTYTVRVTNGAGARYAATASATVRVPAVAASPASASATSASAATTAAAKSAATDISGNRADATREPPVTLDANSTLRLADSITGDVTLLNLAEASLKNLRYEVTDANAGAG